MNHVDLDALVLKTGSHNGPDDGLCFMEAVAYFAGEPHSDHPRCVSPILGAFLRRFNDDLDDESRQRLKAYIPRVVGTAGDRAADQRRAWMAADWMLHVHLPTWLDAAGMHDPATQVRALPTIDNWDAWHGTRSVVLPIRDAAWKLRDEKMAPIREAVRAAVTKRLAVAEAAAVAVAEAEAEAEAGAAAVAEAEAGAGAGAVAAAAAAAVAVAAAAAVAGAVAVAVAGAVAAAVAAAVAEAAAVAGAVAVAEAVAAAAAGAVAAAEAGAEAVAVAVAAAEAAAAAGAVYWPVYRAVRDALIKVWRKAITEDPRVGPVAAAMQDSAFELLDQMIECGATVAA